MGQPHYHQDSVSWIFEERERGRQRQRQAETDKDRNRDRDRDRETYNQKQVDRKQTVGERDEETEREGNKGRICNYPKRKKSDKKGCERRSSGIEV